MLVYRRIYIYIYIIIYIYIYMWNIEYMYWYLAIQCYTLLPVVCRCTCIVYMWAFNGVHIQVASGRVGSVGRCSSCNPCIRCSIFLQMRQGWLQDLKTLNHGIGRQSDDRTEQWSWLHWAPMLVPLWSGDQVWSWVLLSCKQWNRIRTTLWYEPWWVHAHDRWFHSRLGDIVQKQFCAVLVWLLVSL